MTNADWIRAKSDAGLAIWLTFHMACDNCPLYRACGKKDVPCEKQLFKWLQEEHKPEEMT